LLRFYIIITPRSLRYLKFALWSLNLRKDFEITLVSNGLSPNEINELRRFSQEIGCEYRLIKAEEVLPHGAALDQLLSQHNLNYFCFCDSDIISLDPQANDIPLSEELKGLSSCEALFWGEETVKGVLGRCNRWPDGSKNLSSFFCVYHTKTIKELMEKYGIGFEGILASEIWSDRLQALLKKKGIANQYRKLDTGKALTLALEAEGHAFKHVDIPSLLHIGGISSWILNGDTEIVHSEYHLTDDDLYTLAPEGSWLYNKNAVNDSRNLGFYLRRQQRLAAARYCFQLISYFADKTPKPRVSISDNRLRSKIEKVECALSRYYDSCA